MEGTFKFEIVKGSTLIVSDSQASPVKNQMEIKVTYDRDEEPEISEIDFVFPLGTESTDFSELQNLKQIEFKVDGWTVTELTREEFEQLKNGKKEPGSGNEAWYACRYEQGDQYTYALEPGAAWRMKDHLIMDLGMENVVTTAKEGSCSISCSVEDAMEDLQNHELKVTKKRNHSVRILDFYPETGFARKGEEVKLCWFTENAEKLILYSGGEERKLEPSQNSAMVTVTKSTEYVLKAVNGEKVDRRVTMIQVTPLFLKQFAVNYEEKTVTWDVCCGENIKINGIPTQFASGTRKLEDGQKGKPIVLTAEGKNTSVESAVYYGTEEQSSDVVHFQKTITFFNGFQILDVSWELFEIRQENAAQSIRIVYQDRERNELYDIQGGEALGTKGCWQQILTGTEPSRAGENILMTMYVKLFRDGEAGDYEITI